MRSTRLRSCVAVAFTLLIAKDLGSAEPARPEIQGHATGAFHLEKLGSRWWLVTPDGHGTFVLATSLVDSQVWGNGGGFLSYDAAYIETGDGLSANLAREAASTTPRDVNRGEATVKEVGDAIYLGWRLRPNWTYFWLDRVGVGGEMEWWYSSAGAVPGWLPVNGSGKPFSSKASGPGGAYSFDAGDFMAPGKDGFGAWGSKSANLVVWFDLQKGFPDDFRPVALSSDPVPRYYLKGVVTRKFSTAPVLNQAYERSSVGEAIQRKYGPGDCYEKWARAVTDRLRSWGFNATGMYSYRYWSVAPKLEDPLPEERTWALSGWAMRGDYPYKVKNVYAGAVCPPGSSKLRWQGRQADVFEPGYRVALKAEAEKRKGEASAARGFALIPEEADYLFGIDSLGHDHLGYIVLSQNPYKVKDRHHDVTYTDPRLYAKYALRDFLRDRYRDPDESLPPFTTDDDVPRYMYAETPRDSELRALRRLNAAWGTTYTTWGTSSGDLVLGTNAWGEGSGLMDEDGRGILYQGTCSIQLKEEFTDPEHPAVRRDLDDYISLFAERYGKVLADAFRSLAHPPLFVPIYDGPESVYRAIAPYVDGFWVHTDAAGAVRIYNAAHRPLIVADYLTANPDSPSFFRGRITHVSHDPATDRTRIVAPGMRYVFRMSWFCWFPEVPEAEFQGGRCGYLVRYPRIVSAAWDTVEVAGDYSRGVLPGMHIEKANWDGPYKLRTQSDRSRAMVDRLDSVLNLKGDDGTMFVVGFEHWALYDSDVSNPGETDNFGILTVNDNAYDGVEARREVGTDARGYAIGGEEADYGDLLGPLGAYLRDIDKKIER